jgi:hypothetical protein
MDFSDKTNWELFALQADAYIAQQPSAMTTGDLE